MKPWEKNWEDDSSKPWEKDWEDKPTLGEKIAENVAGSYATFSDSYLFGIPTKVGGVLNATLTAPYDWATNDVTRKDRYNEIVDVAERDKEQYQKNYPAQSLIPTAAGFFTNPTYRVAGEFITGGNTVKTLKDILGVTKRGTAVGAGLALADDIIKEGETNPKKLVSDTVLGAGFGGLASPILEAGNAVKKLLSKSIKATPEKIGAFVDEKLNGVLGRTAEEIDDFIKKYSSGATGDEATIGTEAKKIADNAYNSIKEAIKNKYETAKQYYNKEGSAYTDNVVSAIEDLQKRYLPKSKTGKFLEEQMKVLRDNPTVEQLLGFKQELGDLFKKGEAYALAKEQLGKIYHAANKDYFRSMIKHAYQGKGQEAVRITKSADKSFEFMHKPGGVYDKLMRFANPKTAEGTVGSNFIGKLTTKRSDANSLKYLDRFADTTPLKESVIDYTRSQRAFNKLSPQGKKFVYGKNLPEFEDFFNNSLKDQLINKSKAAGNGLSSILDKLKMDSSQTPYIEELAREILNRIIN